MKAIGRWILYALSLLLMFVAIPQLALANEPEYYSNEYFLTESSDLMISISNVTAMVGELIEVDISLDHNPSGIHAMNLALDFDTSQLEIISITRTGLGLQFREPFTSDSLFFWGPSGQNIYGTGVIATVQLRVLPGATGVINIALGDSFDTSRFGEGFSIEGIAPVFIPGSLTAVTTTSYTFVTGADSYGRTTYTFNFTGSIQSIDLPAGTYLLEVWGASGGTNFANTSAGNSFGGAGGYSRGELTLTSNQRLYIGVGGVGSDRHPNGIVASGGFNGGGRGGSATDTAHLRGAGGGGATHIATSTGTLEGFNNRRSDVLLVAGAGGGGDSTTTHTGGFGGGLTAGNSGGSPNNLGGTQTSGFTFGRGQDGGTTSGGGGAGWFGGYAGLSGTLQGAGGSGFIGAVASGESIPGNQIMPNPNGGNMTGNTGHGVARITRLDQGGDVFIYIQPDPPGYINRTIGDPIIVPINIRNNPGLGNYDIVATINPSLLPFVNNVAVSFGNVTSGFLNAYNPNYTPSSVRIGGASGLDLSHVDGTIAYLVLNVSANAPRGIHPVELEVRWLDTVNNNSIVPISPVTVVDGYIELMTLMLGDVDGDGLITVRDSQLVLLYLAGAVQLLPWQLIAADVDLSGYRDIVDANTILRIAIGLEPAPDLLNVVRIGSDDPSALGLSPFIQNSGFVQEFVEDLDIIEPMAFIPESPSIVTVPITLENNAGLSGFDITLYYDSSVLIPLGFTTGNAWSGLAIFNADTTGDYIKLVGASGNNVTSDGVIGHIVFDTLRSISDVMDYVALEVVGLAHVNTDINRVERLGGYIIADTAIVFDPTSATLTGTVRSFNPQIPVYLELLQNNVVVNITTIEADGGMGQSTREFRFDGVQPGVYSIRINKAGHTSFTINNVDTNALVTGGIEAEFSLRNSPLADVQMITLIPGDLTGTGYVTVEDLFIVMNNLDRPVSELSGVAAFADITGSGYVTVEDIFIVMNNLDQGSTVINKP